MPAIFFALVSFLGWGIGDVFATITTRKIGSYSTSFWYLFLGLFISTFYAIFNLDKLQNLTFATLALTLMIGAAGIGGLIAFYEGLTVGNAPLVGTISSSSAAIAVILSLIFLKQRIDSYQALSILLIFSGIVISSLNFKEIKFRSVLTDKGILFALVAMILWGLYYTFIKLPINQIGWFWTTYIATVPVFLIYLLMRIRKIKLQNPFKHKAVWPLLLNTILLGGGAFSLNIAIEKGLTAVVVPIAGAYPVLFALLAFFVFKDPIIKQQVIGIILTLIGIVLLSFFSV